MKPSDLRDILVRQTDYYALATSLRERGVPFKDAYEMIFGKPPRDSHLTEADYLR